MLAYCMLGTESHPMPSLMPRCQVSDWIPALRYRGNAVVIPGIRTSWFKFPFVQKHCGFLPFNWPSVTQRGFETVFSLDYLWNKTRVATWTHPLFFLIHKLMECSYTKRVVWRLVEIIYIKDEQERSRLMMDLFDRNPTERGVVMCGSETHSTRWNRGIVDISLNHKARELRSR